MKQIILLVAAVWIAAASAQAAEFKVTSPELSPGGTMEENQVLNGFGCKGGNLSPALAWQGAPSGTKSFAVTVYDPDAPTGSGWWHWTVFNIPVSVTRLPAGAGKTAPLPEGARQGRTDFGAPGYGGACPPQGHGPHAYHFKVWALDTESLPLDGQASGAMVGFFLSQHRLATAEIVVYYER